MAEEFRLVDDFFIRDQIGGRIGTVIYLMRGIDLGGPFPSYHYWKSVGLVDTDGSDAAPLPFGGPLAEIVVVGII